MVLGSQADDTVQDDEAQQLNSAQDGDTVDGVTDQLESSASKRRSVKGKPRIPTAIDTSRLNKHLTNIWSAKRKKPSKKISSSVSVADAHVHQSEQQMEGVEGSEEPEPVSAQASTVIIVKTLPTKVADVDKTQQKTDDIESDDTKQSEPQKGSRDIAERLKAKKQRFVASTDTVRGGKTHEASANSKVTCELCAEPMTDYSELVSHVRRQHEDCTYVRSYLDEIQPIADARTAVSLPCSACGRTFAGQAALAAHRYECSSLSAAGRVSKLGAQRKRVTANFMSEHKANSAASGQQNGHEIPSKSSRKSTGKDGRQKLKCDQCKRQFTSEDNLTKHVAQVHSQKSQKTTRVSGAKKGKAGSASKSTGDVGGKSHQTSNAAQAPAAAVHSQCDHCKASFSRTSLLITHMKYCLKADQAR